MDSEKIELILDELDNLFQDDLIMDITKEYYDLLLDRAYYEDVFRGIIDQYKQVLEDYEHYGHYAWIALAMFQYKIGRLKKNIKKKALEILDKDINNYNNLIDPILTLDELCDIKYLLNTDLPPKLKIPRPEVYKCDWKEGDVFAFPLVDWESKSMQASSIPGRESDIHLIKEFGLTGKYIMFVTNTVYKEVRGRYPIISIYNWYGDKPMNDLEAIKKLEYLPYNLVLDEFDSRRDLFRPYIELGFEFTKTSEQKDNLIYIGNIGKVDYDLSMDMYENAFMGPWMSFDKLSGHIASKIDICEFYVPELGYKVFEEENKIITIPKSMYYRFKK